jgi:hypothetical protein
MRTTLLSTSKLKTYRITSISIMLVILGIVVAGGVYSLVRYEMLQYLVIIPVYLFAISRIIKRILRIRSISFDSHSVYYNRKEYEVQIPFEDIKNIEIKTISGIYQINLYEPAQDGDTILFKTSLWYPLNFRRKDAEVNTLRDKIAASKKMILETNQSELPGYRV